MAGDRRSGDAGACGPAIRPLGHEGDLGTRGGRHSVSVGQPGEKQDQGGERRLGWLGSVVIPDYAHQLREPLVPTGGVSGDGSIETSLSRLPDATFGVDHEVVGDVIPALVGAGVEVVPAAQDPRHVRGGVPVAARRMVDDQELDILGFEGAFGGKIGAPTRSRFDGQGPRGSRRQGGSDRQAGPCGDQLTSGYQAHQLKP